ncbi:hypothetical protein JTB14_030629 [Gonioctena quinquepunctata]|nr:hypothetical protein JTB14_030629 [Gonioctena quinquepunctata]
MDSKHSKVIPTPTYLLRLIECKNYSERKYLKSDKLEDKVEYLEIHKAVKEVLCYRTRMAKHHQQKSKALARVLAKCIKRAVARSKTDRMLMKTTLDNKYEIKYKGTQSAITKLIPIHEDMCQQEH